MSNIPEYVLIDEEDREKLEAMGKWYIAHGYCVRGVWIKEKKKQKTIRMHRVIINPPGGMEVDHINGNRLDNRKENLRIVTHQQNMHNYTKAKGYCWHKKSNKWRAQIKLNGKKTHLGLFNTESEARQAYLDAKAIYHVIPDYIRPL